MIFPIVRFGKAAEGKKEFDAPDFDTIDVRGIIGMPARRMRADFRGI
jgi:hypothetical protein